MELTKLTNAEVEKLTNTEDKILDGYWWTVENSRLLEKLRRKYLFDHGHIMRTRKAIARTVFNNISNEDCT